MDEPTRKMIAEAYDETLDEALAQGRPQDVAHREAITAASMFYAAIANVADAEARAVVETIGLAPS